MKNKSFPIALGGMLTAAAVVVMALGSLIPVNTYVCPVICILLTRPVLEICSRKIGWCYYFAVSLLSLMLAPDREAALVYTCLGYYPMIRPAFQRLRPLWLRNIAKILFFTCAGAISWWLAVKILGLPPEEELAGLFLVVLVVLWDAVLLLTDRLLGLPLRKRK